MEIVDQVKEITSQEFPGSEAKLDLDAASGKVSGFLIWDQFVDLDQTERQRLLWKTLRAKLGAAATRLSILFTYTHDEYNTLLGAEG